MREGNGSDTRRVAHEVTRRVVNVPNPPAGQGFTHPVPGSVTERIVAVTFVLTNAAGGNPRVPTVTYVGPDSQPFGVYASPFTLAAATAARFTFAVGINQFGANNAAQIGAPLPPDWLEVGHSIVVGATNLGNADTFTLIRLRVVDVATRPDVERPEIDPELAMGDWRFTAR